jgi:hypothetical protein
VPQRIVTETHQWIIAVCIPADPVLAKRAVDRLSFRAGALPDDLKISALEVYCAECRRPYEDVEGVICEAAASNEHLRGGPIGERAKRKHMYHDCEEVGCPPEVRPDASRRAG